MITVSGLTKSYADLRRGQFVALDGLSFQALPGQIYGLLGPNGAGKTTALRILSTVLQPSGGTATVNGFDVVRQPSQVRRQIGFVSVNTAVYDRMTAWEMVEYFGRLNGIPPDELRDRMEAIFAKLKMGEIRDVLGAKMSTGMKQKVSIARAIVHDPPVLIFDEATSGLDVLVARALLERVAELRAEGKCIIFSTHIMREAEKLCDRVAILHRGQILAEGTVEELRSKHGEEDLEELFFQLISREEEASEGDSAGLGIEGDITDRSPTRKRGIKLEASLALSGFDGSAGKLTMNLTNVKLILAREVRDQLRDRRTLFMIFVLPVLLYPLLGSVFVKMRQFQSQKPMSVLVFGGKQLEKSLTPLIDGKRFSVSLFPEGPEAAKLLELTIADEGSSKADADRLVRDKDFDAALVFPPDFAQRLEAYREAIQEATARARGIDINRKPDGTLAKAGTTSTSPPGGAVPEIPRPKIIYTAANDGSLIAFNRLAVVLDRWTEELGKTNLVASGLPAEAVQPFKVDSANLAGPTATQATNLWSRILPVLLLLWAMTGAFYPAIDLCAGEKERGTLETLLSSPAERSEIVVGKLLTIMVFSMVTAALNLICVGLIGGLLFRQLPGFGGPPPLAVVWLVLAMVPISALFSALCLALASFARSTKEGQYYLMPLLMLTMPLAVLPIMPGMELGMGNALVPISGLVLLLKTLLEGSYRQALQFLPVVLAVTFLSCWLAVRWAVEQFKKESVLFRESERFHLGLWLKQLLRDRGPLPTPAQGLFCGVLILALSFVVGLVITPAPGFKGFIQIDLITQFGVILVPALAMAWMFTRSPRRTLLLMLPRWQMLPAAAVLAVGLHPFIVAVDSLVVWLYPISPEVQAKLAETHEWFASADVWLLVLLVAALPAICEELAFRGFILSGFRSWGKNRSAIIVSALFFGVAHGLLQQSINAFVMGLVLGWLAVQSGSLLPGVVFHFLHNSTTVLVARITPELIEQFPPLGFLVHLTNEGPSYQWPVYVFGGVASLALLSWLAWFPKARAAEEHLEQSFTRTDSIKGAAF